MVALLLMMALTAPDSGLALGADGPVYEVTDPALALTDEVTLEAWVQGGGGRILDKITPGGQDGFLLDAWPAGTPRLITAAGQLRCDAPLATDRWSHVVGVYSASRQIARLFLDGREVANRTEGPWPALAPNDLPLRIGVDQTGGSRFAGRIRQAAVYRRALSAEEVARRTADPAAQLDGVLGDWSFVEPAPAKLRPAAGALVLTGPTVFAGTAPAPAEPLSLWYRQPGRRWTEALLLGNGRLGAMVAGGVPRETVWLNDDTLWSGGPGHWQNPEALAALPEIRRLVFAGKMAEAHALTRQKMHGTYNQCYEPAGELWLELPEGGEVTDYRRDLDLRRGVATVSYQRDGARYTREAFSSAADQCLVLRLTCDKARSLSLRAGLHTPLRGTLAVEDGDLVLHGRAPAHADPSYAGSRVTYADDRGMRYTVRLRPLTRGTVQATADGLTIDGADEVLLLLSVRTSFNGPDQDPLRAGRDDAALAKADLAAAATRPFAELLARHTADHGALMDRVRLDLGTAPAMPTDERLKAYRPGADPALAALYYQFGRYLLVSGSRPGSQPLNLQGIWNVDLNPAWSANWTLNCNAQINYWGCEQANLGDLSEPIRRMTAELMPDGAKTAREMFGADGWVAFHNTDLWRGAAPVDGDPLWFIFQVGGAWLCQHVWEHYAFTRDDAYLRQAWPVLSGAARYYLDTLVPEPKHGWLVDVPATNFENTYRTPDGQTASVCAAPTADVEMIGELFDNVVAASRILGVEPELAQRVGAARAKLPPLQVSPRTGQLQEWMDDWDHADARNGQMLSLWGLICGTSIDRRRTPELAAATRRAMIERRIWEPYGGTASSWTGSFASNGFARLGDRDNAAMVLDNHLARSVNPNLTAHFAGAGSAFQIDGNMGQMAAIGLMLLQSSADEIELLPAPPKAWANGSVTGLRARGGFSVDLTWRDGALTAAAVRSATGGKTRLRYGDQVREITLTPGQAWHW